MASALRSQLREAAEEGQYRDDYSGDHLTGTAEHAAWRAAQTGGRFVRQRAQAVQERMEHHWEDSAITESTPISSMVSTHETATVEPKDSSGWKTSGRDLETLTSARQDGAAPAASARKSSAIKTKDMYIQQQPEYMPTAPQSAQRVGEPFSVCQGRALAERQAAGMRLERRGLEADVYPARTSTNTIAQSPSVGKTVQGQRSAKAIRQKTASPKHPITKARTASERTAKVRAPVPAPKAMRPPGYPAQARAAGQNIQRLRTLQTKAKSAAGAIRRTSKASLAALRAIASSNRALIVVLPSLGGMAVAVVLVVVLFGGLLSMTGGTNAEAALPLSEEVQAYEPVIRRYAAEYGIAEYVPLIQAIMMQESGGRGLDPMQASESGYNTRYPNTPGAITVPEYSIQCGVQTIRDVLERAGVESPLDLERIKLALQGYNFGPGYITWAISNYGGYSLSNSEEFSAMMAEQMGWSRYGDTQYVPYVLRYYTLGWIPSGGGNASFVQVALSQEGSGGETYWRWYGFDSRVSWCACFVSWCADQCGLIDAGVMPKFSLCSDGVAWFAARGRLMDASSVPSPGDLIFFDWGGDGNVDHVGIVENVADGTVYTVEGNSGNRVRRRDYSLGSAVIYGYGVLILD